MLRTKKITCILLSLVMIASISSACSKSNSASGENVVMNVGLLGDPIRLDPAFAYDNDTSVIIDNITEALLTHNPDNSLKPNLASSWEATDPTTYVYHIRNDVYFSDGNQMTTEDVVYSLKRHMDPDLGSYMNWFFENVASIDATGDWEITVKLKEPAATWKYVLATSAGMIVEKKYAEEKGSDFGSAEGGIIGTGPFVYDSWVNGSKVILKKNKNYWDKSATTNVSQIVFNVITDDTTLATAVKSGQIDMSVNWSTNLLDTFQSYDNITVYGFNGMGVHYLAFNTARAPFDDVNVRKAIGYAIDLDSIINNIVKETGSKGGLLPMSDSLFTVERDSWVNYVQKIGGHEFNLDKAKEYMAKSSVPNGFSCKLMVSQSASQRYDVALVVQQALKEINIDVEVVTVTSDEFYTYQFGNVLDSNGVRDYDMLVATWGADYPDPSANIDPLFSIKNIAAGGYNCASYSNETVDALLTKANGCTDEKERMDLLMQVCDYIVADQPYYFYNYPKQFAFVSKNYAFGEMNLSSAWDWNFKDMVYHAD